LPTMIEPAPVSVSDRLKTSSYFVNTKVPKCSGT